MAGEAFGIGRPELKGELARLGQTLHPEAQVRAVVPPPPGEHVAVVLLDRVVEGVTPAYCTHGYASCVNCRFLCWIGDETEKVLTSGRRIYALCLDCAPSVVPKDAERAGRVEDHRRADGPHGA